MRFRIPNKYYKNIIAGIVVLCMLVADLGMLNKLPKYTVISEEHEMDVAMADGEYDGRNSDNPMSKEYPVIKKEEKEIQHPFNVLEILPTVKKGVIGYTVSGLEPFEKENGDPILPIRDSDGVTILATEAQMREAYMDAVINAHPGIDDANSTNNSPQLVKDIVGNMSTWLKESGNSDAFNISTYGMYNGYYKYVGPDKGVFAKGSTNSRTVWDNTLHKNVDYEDREMFSRFYDYDPNKQYDYIFVYSEDTGDPEKGDVSVRNHRRIKYENNDRFIRDCLGVSGDNLQKWKGEHEVKVSTRDPHSVSLQDIENADLIVINNGTNMGYHKIALQIYNLTHQYKLPASERDLDLDNEVVFSATNDFDSVTDANNKEWSGFEKSIRIYERVVVRQDAALIASKNCISGHVFDTNIRKLMCMLFFVRDDKNNNRDENNQRLGDLAGSGREFFMELMKRYVSEPGNYKIGVGNDPQKTYWDLRTENDCYIAPTLRNNTWNYMHHHLDNVENHPGHPLTTEITNVVTGGHFENGVLVPDKPYYDNNGTLVIPGKVYNRTIRRSTGKNWGGKNYFEYEGFSRDDSRKPGYYYYMETKNGTTGGDVLLSDAQAKEHPLCLDGYESMSNTTDFMYIDDDGNLQRDDKYSSDNGYWYHIDADDGNMYAFKRLKWDAYTWKNWPWNEKMEPWLMQKGTYEREGSDKGNMHLEYDYYDANFPPYAYRGLSDIDPGKGKFKNQSLVEENGMLKADHIKNILKEREVCRENQKEIQVVKKNLDCYVSMNILNGDGVNTRTTDASKKNKVLYYNVYEAEKIIQYENANPTKAKIPIRIRIRVSCPLSSITVADKEGVIARYSYDESNKNVGKDIMKITCTGDKGKTLVLDRVEGTYKADKTPIKKDDEGNEVEDKTTNGDYIYTYEGLLYDVTNDKYLGKRNEEVTVTIVVSDQNGDPKLIQDKITIVQRDFFMLN